MKEVMFKSGIELAERFCGANKIPMPTVNRLSPQDRLYHLATCAYYRPNTIHIMVEKCACRGYGGRAWSWPGYTVDRTPYGVVQHELGHHVDNHFYDPKPHAENRGSLDGLFSKKIYEQSREPQLTGYLGTDTQAAAFFMEWFAENFRLFVTNPHLSNALRPKFYKALISAGIAPVEAGDWESVLMRHGANERIISQARKKVDAVTG